MKVSYRAILISLLFSILVVTVDASPARAATTSVLDGPTLTITQTVDDGDLTIDNNGAGNGIRAIDGSGTTDYGAGATALIVNLLPDTGNVLNLDLDSAFPGSVTLNLGDGLRTVNLTGSVNTIGSLTIIGGAGNQTVELATTADPVILGTLAVDLGLGTDRVDENGFNLTVGSDFLLTGANFENDGTMTVVGNVFFDQRGDDQQGDFDNDSVMNISGNLTYEGGDMSDDVNLNADFSLAGNLVARTRNGASNYNLNNTNTDIQGSVTLIATEDTAVDDLETNAGAVFAGGISVDLGDGPNNAEFFGSAPGATSGNYVGGTGVDTVRMRLDAPGMDFVVRTDGSGDSFELDPPADLNSLYVDLGCGGVDMVGTTIGFPVWWTVVNQGPCVLPTPDLEVEKTNDTAGVVASGEGFEWKVSVANGDFGDAVFADGDAILLDNLPSGADYSMLTVENDVNVLGVDRIDCSIAGQALTCVADGPAGVIVGGSTGLGAGSFDVTIQVMPTRSGLLENTCIVDPDSNVAESNEANNTCADTVMASPVIEALVPGRLFESRVGFGTVDGMQEATGRRSAGQVTEVMVGGRGGVPGDALAAVVNVAAVGADGQGFITLYPCGSPRPDASTLNYAAGQVIANGAIIQLGDGGKVCVYTHRAMDLIVDVTGYVPAGSTFGSLVPGRLFESRVGFGTVDGMQEATGRRSAGQVTEVMVGGRGGVPGDALAAVVNVAAVGADGQGFITLYPCGSPRPDASTLNYAAGQVIANGAIIQLGDGGKVCVYTHRAMDLIVDVTGFI